MRSILFGLLCLILAASVVISFASGMQIQQEWARDTCRIFGRGCDNPWIVYAAASVLLVLYLLARMTQSS